MPETRELAYQLGALEGRVSSIQETLNSTNQAIFRLEERLRKNESDTTSIMVKVGALSSLAGGIGSIIVQVILSQVK